MVEADDKVVGEKGWEERAWVGGVNVAAGTTPSSRRAKITPLGVVL